MPIEYYLGLGRGQGNGHDSPTDDAAASQAGDPDCRIEAALAVGSTSLFDALERSGGSDDRDIRSAGKRLRYLIRMSTRPTPFGLFAGVGISHWAPVTDLAVGPGRPRTRTRPDMEWLLRLALEQEARPEVRRHLRYFANPRAFVQAGRVVLPEPAPTAAAGSGSPVSVRATRVVREALSVARIPVEHSCLVAELVAATGATVEKVEGLIDELWRQTILLTDLRPPLTNADPAAYLAARLTGIPAAADALRGLDDARTAMAEWDEMPLEGAAHAYRALASRSAGDGEAETPPQVDMALPLLGRHLTETVAMEAARAAEILMRLTPLPMGLPHMAAYRGAFGARYGHEREVPLLELLDPTYGLGPPLGHHGGAPGGDPQKAALRYQTLNSLALEALRDRRPVVELDDDALSRLETWSPSAGGATPSLDLSLFVLAASAAELDAGRFQVVVGPNLGATAAGRNLGRFADLLGDEAEVALHELGRAEAALDPDSGWAELVYLPRRFRSANVVVRPHPRRYEIPVGLPPGVPQERVIAADELVVGIRAGRFYARCPALGIEVIPCAGHMLNNMQAPDVCQFLDEVRRDGLAQFSAFDWGPAAGLPVLPRVRAGRVVLSAAQWRIDSRVKTQLAPDRPGFSERLSDWRERWDVPRYVYLALGDNRLLLDLEDEAQGGELRAEISRLGDGHPLLLQEALPSPDDAWVPGPGGHFIAELVVPLVLRHDPAATAIPEPRKYPAVATTPAPVSTTDRLRLPGSDWLFAKLYCPRSVEDDLLIRPVAEVCDEALGDGTADGWFFIRYSDPERHIRLRFHGDPERLVGKLIPDLCSWASGLIADGRCSRLCFDTYDRELERYGGAAGTAVAEAIFGADSRAVVEMLRLIRHGVLRMDLTTLAVLSIDDLLAGLGANEAERRAWYEEQVPSRNSAGEEYRRLKATLRPLLSDPEYLLAEPGGDALSRVLASRRHALAGPSNDLSLLAERGELSQAKTALYRSYVHLHCNRLMSSDGPPEGVLLALLKRTRYGLSQG